MVKEVEGCPAKTAISAIRDLAIFCGDTRDASLKQEREAGSGNFDGEEAEFPIFMSLGCGE